TFAQPDGNIGAIVTPVEQLSTPPSGTSNSTETLAWLKRVLHPVGSFAASQVFLHNSEAPTNPEISARVSSGSESVIDLSGARVDGRASVTPTAKPVTPMSGETVTVNGSGGGFTLPGGKSITITYQATVNSPPLVRFVQTQGNVTFTGGPGGGINTTD